MSKKKKKKKSDRERKSKDYKKSWIFILIVVFVGVLSIAYEKIFGTIILNVHNPYYFISHNSDAFDVLMIILLGFVIISSAAYLFREINTPKKKYIIRSSAITIIMLIGITVFNCNVWTFDKDTFSYNTLFQKDKIVYSYDEIESADVSMYFTAHGKYGTTYHIEYTLHMNNNEKITFNAYEAYYTDEDKIIEFDKAISNKRTLKSEDYDDFLYRNEELNEYFDSVYNNQN